MTWRDRIEIKPGVLAGKPVVKDTRIAVELVVDLLAHGWERNEILQEYPALSRDDVQACLSYASETLKSERVYSLISTPEV